MKSYLFGSGSGASQSLQNWYAIHTTAANSVPTPAATEPLVGSVFPCSGTISNFCVQIATAPTSGRSYTFSPYINGSASSLSTTISDASLIGTDSTNSVSVNAGDSITISSNPSGTPVATAAYWDMEFDSTNPKEFPLLANMPSQLSTTTTQYIKAQGGGSSISISTTETDVTIVIPYSGTISKFYGAADVAPGAGRTRTFTVMKNGAAQSLAFSLTGTGSGAGITTNNDTANSFTVAAGDRISIRSTVSGTPAASRFNSGLLLTSDVDGYSMMGFTTNLSPGTATIYNIPYSQMRSAWNTTESNSNGKSPQFLAKALYVWQPTAPVSGRSYTYTLRQAAADTALAATVAGPSNSGSATADVGIARGNGWTIKSTSSGSPASSGGLHGGIAINYIATDNRYWVGGSANWDATAGTKWSLVSGSSGGAAVPTSADNVFFDANSGSGNITIPASTVVTCRSITCTGFTGTLTFAATTSQLTIGDGSGGSMTLAAGMTLTLTGNGTINFVSTSNNSSAGWDITTGGKTLPNVIFNGAGGGWKLQDAMVSNSTVTLTAGTLNTNGKACTWPTFLSTGASTRVLTMGTTPNASAISCATWATASSGLTVSANDATVTQSGINANFDNNAASGGVNYNGLSLVQSGLGVANFGYSSGSASTITLLSFTRTGTAVKTDELQIGTPLTATNFTVTGNSAINRVQVTSHAIGTSKTITAANTTLSDVDFMDITGAGAASWSGTSVGDCQGNSGITFTTPVNRYAVTAGNWSSTGMWSTASGGSSGASVPLPQDSVYFNASSGAGTYAADMPRLGKNIDCTGFSRTLSFSSITANIYGSLLLMNGMTFTNTQTVRFWGRSSHSITSNGEVFGTILLHFVGPGGSYALSDPLSLTGTTSLISLFAGTLNLNGTSITTGSISFGTSGLTRTLNAANSTINILSDTAGTFWDATAVTGLTVTTNTSSNFVIANASSATRIFAGAGLTYGSLVYTVASSTGQLTISGSNIFNTLAVSSGRTLALTSGTTQTVANWNVSGDGFDYLPFPGVSGNYVLISQYSATNFTTQIDVRVRVNADWDTVALNLATKWSGALNRSWKFFVSGKYMYFYASGNGNATASIGSTVPASLTANTTYWLRVTRRSSDGRVQFFQAPDSAAMPTAVSGWTQVGSDVILGSGVSLFNATAGIEIGSENGGASFYPFNLYYVQMRSNVNDDGTGIGFDADFTSLPAGTNAFTESSGNGGAVVIFGSAMQSGDGRLMLNSTTPGTAALISKQGGIASSNQVVVKDITSILPYTMYMGTKSSNVSGNTAVEFTAPITAPYWNRSHRISAVGANTITATFPIGSATAGNLLVATLVTSTTSGSITGFSGWTLVTSVPSASTTTYMYYKIAAGGETSLTIGTANTINLYLSFVEIAGFTTTPTLDVWSSNTAANGSSSVSTTATTGPTNTVVPAFSIVAIGHNGANTPSSWTNSYVEDITSIGSNALHISAKPLTSAASNSTTFTWTTTRAAMAILAVFGDAPIVVGTNFRTLMGVGG